MPNIWGNVANIPVNATLSCGLSTYRLSDRSVSTPGTNGARPAVLAEPLAGFQGHSGTREGSPTADRVPDAAGRYRPHLAITQRNSTSAWTTNVVVNRKNAPSSTGSPATASPVVWSDEIVQIPRSIANRSMVQR